MKLISYSNDLKVNDGNIINVNIHLCKRKRLYVERS